MNDELRTAIFRFTAQELRVNVERLRDQTQLGRDLRVDGADGWEFIEAFGAQFRVDISTFEPMRHFGPEAGPSPLHWLWWAVTRSWPRLVPITLADLIVAAKTGRWPGAQLATRPAI